MKIHPYTHAGWLGRRLISSACALLTVSLATALAVANRAAAGEFAATTLSPSTQTAVVGTPCTVDVVFAVGSLSAYGIQAWIKFDPTTLQAVSVTTGGSSPFGTVFANQIDNTSGTVAYGATGGTVTNTTVTVAKIVFNPIAAGTSTVQFVNVNEYIAGYGPYGVNGAAVGGSVTVTAPPAVTVFASGISPVIAWDPIYPATAYPNWTTESKPVPTVGYNANWTNPHPASVFPKNTHPWENIAPMNFDANWINAWDNITSQGPAGQSWTKYSTTVTGEGDFVLQFLADNASWIYIDGNLVAFQDWDWTHNSTGRYTIHLSGPGPHELSFIIWDGGGAAGGKFRLETTQSFQNNNPGVPLPPPPPPSDTTPPVIANLSASTTTLWPANHKMVAITLSASATDAVDGSVPVKITGVTSSEPDDGLGDGDTPVDVQITGALTLNLRAERGGKGNGRTYTVHVEARDAAGNVRTASIPISVPKSQGK